MGAVSPESNPEKLSTPVLVKTINVGKDAVCYDIQNEAGAKTKVIKRKYPFPWTMLVLERV